MDLAHRRSHQRTRHEIPRARAQPAEGQCVRDICHMCWTRVWCVRDMFLVCLYSAAYSSTDACCVTCQSRSRARSTRSPHSAARVSRRGSERRWVTGRSRRAFSRASRNCSDPKTQPIRSSAHLSKGTRQFISKLNSDQI